MLISISKKDEILKCLVLSTTKRYLVYRRENIHIQESENSKQIILIIKLVTY